MADDVASQPWWALSGEATTAALDSDPEFLTKAKYAPWVDTVIRFTGPIVRHSQHVFASDWMAYNQEDISDTLLQPLIPPTPGFPAQEEDVSYGPDGYFLETLINPNSPTNVASLGLLDSEGKALALMRSWSTARPGDTLTVNTTPVAGPQYGSLVLYADGTFSYTHDGSENFSDSFTYELRDAATTDTDELLAAVPGAHALIIRSATDVTDAVLAEAQGARAFPLDAWTPALETQLDQVAGVRRAEHEADGRRGTAASGRSPFVRGARDDHGRFGRALLDREAAFAHRCLCLPYERRCGLCHAGRHRQRGVGRMVRH